jgi:hypothetical protein
MLVPCQAIADIVFQPPYVAEEVKKLLELWEYRVDVSGGVRRDVTSVASHSGGVRRGTSESGCSAGAAAIPRVRVGALSEQAREQTGKQQEASRRCSGHLHGKVRRCYTGSSSKCQDRGQRYKRVGRETRQQEAQKCQHTVDEGEGCLYGGYCRGSMSCKACCARFSRRPPEVCLASGGLVASNPRAFPCARHVRVLFVLSPF